MNISKYLLYLKTITFRMQLVYMLLQLDTNIINNYSKSICLPRVRNKG